MEAAAGVGNPTRYGGVGVRACGRVHVTLPEIWRHNAFVGGGEFHQRCCSGRVGARPMRARQGVCSYGKDASWVANVAPHDEMGHGIQSGLGTYIYILTAS